MMRLGLFAAMALAVFALRADAPAAADAAPAAAPVWRNLDDKHFLGGDKFGPYDFDGSLVLLVRVPLKDLSVIPFKDLTEIRRGLKDIPFTQVISISDNVSSDDYLKACRKQRKFSWKSFGAYQDIGQKDGEPKDGDDATLFYVFDHTGKLVCKANDHVSIKRALHAAKRALPERDTFFGYDKPGEAFAHVAKLLEEGRPTLPAYGALRKAAAGKGDDAAQAARLIAALDRTCTWRIAHVRRLVNEEPARALLEMNNLLKMWPRAKADARIDSVATELKKFPEAGKISKLLLEIDALTALEPQKKSEAKAALARAMGAEAKARKLADDDKLPNRLRTEAGRAQAEFVALIERFKAACE